MRVRFPTSKIQIPKRLNKPCIEHKNRVWKRFCEILVALNLATSGSQTEHSNAEIQSERGPVITLMFSMQGEPLGWRLAGHLLPLHPCPNICSLIPKERVGEDLRNQKATQDTFYDSISQWCPLLALYSPPFFFTSNILRSSWCRSFRVWQKPLQSKRRGEQQLAVGCKLGFVGLSDY